jgi:glucan phosphorylase
MDSQEYTTIAIRGTTMSDKPRNYEEELSNIMNAMAESEWELSDEEVLEEARERGEDPESEAERIKDIFRRIFKEHQQAPLREAQRQYEERLSSMFNKETVLPSTPEERRDLLDGFLARMPEYGSALLTAQHREFKDLTDSDVESLLKQLIELGALDSTSGPGDKSG